MQYTFAQACKRLAGRSVGMAGADVKADINEALQDLAGLAGWECLRQVLRFFSAGPCFALPQGSAGLVRLCVNGRPATVRAPDFRFIHSGPGDLRHPPAGFRMVDTTNVNDVGRLPVAVAPRHPFRLYAMPDGDGQPFLTVRGTDPEGRDVTVNVPMSERPRYDQGTGELISGTDEYSAPIQVNQVFGNVTSVVLGDDASSYVTLFAEDDMTGARYPIALYNPFVKVPTFRHYEISDIPPGAPVELLAEVRLAPLPLVRDSDVVPFDSLNPIEWMMRARWCMQSGEVDQAAKYQDRAQQWMKAREIADDQVQTAVVINNAFANSLGEASLETWNI